MNPLGGALGEVDLRVRQARSAERDVYRMRARDTRPPDGTKKREEIKRRSEPTTRESSTHEQRKKQHVVISYTYNIT